MPASKQCFAWLDRDYAPLLPAIRMRLLNVKFDPARDWQVLAVDSTPTSLTIEAVQRKERETPTFDAKANKMVMYKGYTYAARYFTIDAAAHVISTPGSSRDITAFWLILKQLVAPNAELFPFDVELATWALNFLRANDTAQLGQLVLNDLYVEPKLLGRYSAKTVDNCIDTALLERERGRIRSIRLSYFDEGVKRSVEVRRDGVLTCSSQDEDDLASFMRDQTRLYLGTTPRPIQTTIGEGA